MVTKKLQRLRKGVKKLPVIDIFLSSKQNIPERKFLANRIEFLRYSESYPFNPPCLIENESGNMNNIRRQINNALSRCDWIVIVLEDHFSADVRYELNKALNIMNHENIFLFVKETETCFTCWKKELEKIRSLRTIKYLPYTDLEDLEVIFIKAIKHRMTKIYNRRAL